MLYSICNHSIRNKSASRLHTSRHLSLEIYYTLILDQYHANPGTCDQAHAGNIQCRRPVVVSNNAMPCALWWTDLHVASKRVRTLTDKRIYLVPYERLKYHYTAFSRSYKDNLTYTALLLCHRTVISVRFSCLIPVGAVYGWLSWRIRLDISQIKLQAS